MTLVTLIMGSEKDFYFCKQIGSMLDYFGVSYEYRIASAHKTPEYCLSILRIKEESSVYITVAGKANALAGFVDANTTKPVITCPLYSEAFSGMDILSSLRMPSGVASLTVLEPKAAALAAVKILALSDELLQRKVEAYHQQMKNNIFDADKNLKKRLTPIKTSKFS